MGFSGFFADLADDFELGIVRTYYLEVFITTKAMSSRSEKPSNFQIDFFYTEYNICLTLDGSAMVTQASSQPSLLVKPDEAAKLLSISTRTLWTLTREGVVPCVRLGKSVRYSLDSLCAVIAERERAERDCLRENTVVASSGETQEMNRRINTAGATNCDDLKLRLVPRAIRDARI